MLGVTVEFAWLLWLPWYGGAARGYYDITWLLILRYCSVQILIGRVCNLNRPKIAKFYCLWWQINSAFDYDRPLYVALSYVMLLVCVCTAVFQVLFVFWVCVCVCVQKVRAACSTHRSSQKWHTIFTWYPKWKKHLGRPVWRWEGIGEVGLKVWLEQQGTILRTLSAVVSMEMNTHVP